MRLARIAITLLFCWGLIAATAGADATADRAVVRTVHVYDFDKDGGEIHEPIPHPTEFSEVVVVTSDLPHGARACYSYLRSDDLYQGSVRVQAVLRRVRAEVDSLTTRFPNTAVHSFEAFGCIELPSLAVGDEITFDFEFLGAGILSRRGSLRLTVELIGKPKFENSVELVSVKPKRATDRDIKAVVRYRCGMPAGCRVGVQTADAFGRFSRRLLWATSRVVEEGRGKIELKFNPCSRAPTSATAFGLRAFISDAGVELESDFRKGRYSCTLD